NVGFAKALWTLPKAEAAARVGAALDLVGLADYGRRRPAELSGGQRQRVALARCFAKRPRVVLLDEPLANLDAHLREAMLVEFRRFHRETAATFVYVTHDQAERQPELPEGQRRHGAEADDEADERDGIRPEPGTGEPGADCVQRRVDQAAGPGVEHRPVIAEPSPRGNPPP
ncbi:MAG: ATP-binding cassette domain-containing protein, partial [Ferrovibrionaceae bacterium]